MQNEPQGHVNGIEEQPDVNDALAALAFGGVEAEIGARDYGLQGVDLSEGASANRVRGGPVVHVGGSRDALNTLPTRARDHFSAIIPLYDISKGEANAIKLATTFLSNNRQTLDDLKDEHTQLVIDFGFNKALDIINDKCS